MDGGDSDGSCSCVDAAQNRYGTFRGNSTRVLTFSVDVYTLNIRYTAEGATKQVPTLACGYVTPVPVDAEPGVLVFTDNLTYGVNFCSEGVSSLLEQPNVPNVWTYAWASQVFTENGLLEFTPDACVCPDETNGPSPGEPASSGDDLSVGAVVGAAVGGGLFVALVFAAVLLWQRRRRAPPPTPSKISGGSQSGEAETPGGDPAMSNHGTPATVIAEAIPYNPPPPPPRTESKETDDSQLPTVKDQCGPHQHERQGV